jgi:hypothetical protein
MKTSSIILIVSFAVGISIIAVLVIQNPPKNSVGDDALGYEQKSYFQKYWNDQIKLYPDEYVISEKKEITNSYDLGDPLIEINGLKSKYAAEESINFEILAIGNGNGCLSFKVIIRGEDENAPPVYYQEYISSCEVSEKYVGIPLYFAINSENGQITNLDSGKYEITTGYYQDRGNYGDVKQEFTIEDRK